MYLILPTENDESLDGLVSLGLLLIASVCRFEVVLVWNRGSVRCESWIILALSGCINSPVFPVPVPFFL